MVDVKETYEESCGSEGRRVLNCRQFSICQNNALNSVEEDGF